MKIVTNGTFINRGNDKTPEPRKFKVLAQHGMWVWVVPINGLYENEGPLTFNKQNLTEIK